MSQPGAEGGQARTLQAACFVVGDQEYALDIMRIKEIIRPSPITAIPRAPQFVEGIIELRGAFLPVVDLRKRFGLPAPPPARDTKYVIVALEGRIVGLVVDRVVEVRRFEVGEISEAPPMMFDGDTRFFEGVVKSGGRIVMVVDLDAILSPQEKNLLRGLERAEA